MAPPSFITLDGLRRRGWEEIPSGWLVESSRPLTSEQIADARSSAAAGGLTIETRRESPSSTTLIAIATAAGALLALAILAREPLLLGVGIFLVGVASAAFALARHAFMTSFVPIEVRARALSPASASVCAAFSRSSDGSGRCFFRKLRTCGFASAPTNSSITFPPRNAFTFGIPRTL